MKTILIVDDIEMNRKFILPIFEDNFKVLEAANGEEALIILRSNHVDLVITDIFMDKVDGYSLIRAIRKNEQLKDVPIIAVTENDDASQAKAISVGANYFITRPMTSDELKKQTYKLTGQDIGRKELIHSDFLLSSMPGAVFVYKVYDGNFEVITCSRGITELSGWEPEEFCVLLEDATFPKIYPSDQATFVSTMKKVVNTKSQGETMYRGYKKDGSTIWLWLQAHYIGKEDGCALVEALILDVSDNATMYQTVLDQAQSLVTVVDANTFEVLYANQQAKDTIGIISPGQYLGTVCYRHVMNYDKPCPFCIINNTKRDSWVNPQIELFGHFYKQVYKKLKWHGRDAFLEFTTDITDQVESVKTIDHQRKLNATILDTIPAGIMVFKLVGEKIEIVSANRAICDMTGMSGEKAIGAGDKEVYELTHPDDRHIVANVARKLRTPNSYVEYEYRQYYTSRQKYVWVLGQGRSEINPEDGLVYAYISYTDITARKEVETLQEKLKNAETEASAKAEFYSQMSHDMRTPMNGILGLAELAKKENDVDKLHQDIDKIFNSGKYMLGLINDTLDLQRLESGRVVLEPKIIRSKDLFADIFTIINPAIAEKSIYFDFNVGDENKDEMSWYVRIDALRFKQIVTNILSNSIKFTPVGGSISLSLKELERKGNISKNSITITDSGVGMSKDFIDNRLYKPFSQESNEVTEKYGGSGLGLSIVKRLVDLMDGHIEVSSELGEGTTFVIYLDVDIVPDDEVDNIQKTQSIVEEESKHLLNGKCVLLCEDHPLNAEIAQRLLSIGHCDVEWAKDGSIGVKMFEESKQGHYDAILMDIRMPIMDGLEATKAIRSCSHPDAKRVPIIAMSANAYEEDLKKSLEAGMNDHLAKPVNPQMLFDTLARYLNADKQCQ